MRLLVTGANGFIGRNVLLRAPRDWEIVAVSHTTPGLDVFVADQALSNVRVLRCDLSNAGEVQNMRAQIAGRLDAMLYLAANSDPAVSADRPRDDLDRNTATLVTCLEHCPAGHVVFVSSGAVYDGLAGPVSPASAVSPCLPYAISKLASEHYVRFFAERRQTVGSYVNVRFFGAYGPYEPPRKITTRWLLGLAEGQREFVIRGDGKNLIDFMYVDDAVDGFLALLKVRGTRTTVDFASGQPISIDEVVGAMASVLGVDVRVRHEGQVPEYIEFRSIDRTMRERFGVTPRVSFPEGLNRLHGFLSRARAASGDQRTAHRE
ncbi:MAG: NAD-dependent epimerase/dehydratase family protein [Vicinamibacterales bacterium]